MCIYTQPHAQARTHPRTHSRKRAYMCTYTHTQVHIYTMIALFSSYFFYLKWYLDISLRLDFFPTAMFVYVHYRLYTYVSLSLYSYILYLFLYFWSECFCWFSHRMDRPPPRRGYGLPWSQLVGMLQKDYCYSSARWVTSL